MEISKLNSRQYVNKTTHQNNNPKFGMNIYGTKGVYELKDYLSKKRVSEKYFEKFLYKLRELGNDDISVRFLKIKNEDGVNKINYVVSGSIQAYDGNSYYARIKGKSGINISSIKKHIEKSIEELKLKADKYAKAEAKRAEQPLNKKTDKTFFQKIFEKISKIFK